MGMPAPVVLNVVLLVFSVGFMLARCTEVFFYRVVWRDGRGGDEGELTLDRKVYERTFRSYQTSIHNSSKVQCYSARLMVSMPRLGGLLLGLEHPKNRRGCLVDTP
jgi:hypothetical protein